MGVGGDGTTKKGNKSKESADAPSKKSKGSKKQKVRRKRGKGSKTRSRSKTKKSSPSSRASSFTSGGEPTSDGELHNAKENINDYFDVYKNINNTRRIFPYNVPTHSTTLREKNVLYMAINLYNVLPTDVRKIPSFVGFKKEMYDLVLRSEDKTGVACMIKPEKLHQTCATIWSEPTTCCVDCEDKATATSPPCGYAKCKHVCLKVAREENEEQNQARLCVERLSNERDYYRAEFERLLGFFEKIRASSMDEDGNTLCCIACQKKDQMIEYLQRENEVLAKEKFCLMSRLEEGGTRFDSESPAGKCSKASCKRIERERDLLRLDIQRLEEESDSLREKIKALSENKTRDYAKFQEQRTEYENIIRKLEGERRELIKSQGIRRVSINTLEEKVEMYSNLLRVAQEEVNRLKTQYNQLKTLHEQCDKALLDTQAQLMEVETELLNCQNKVDPGRQRRYSKGKYGAPPNRPLIESDTEPEKNISEDTLNTIQQLNNDKDQLLNQLDNKTELLIHCQEDVENKVETIAKLEEELNHLKEELSVVEGQVTELKEKCDESALTREEKDTELKNLQTENEQKLMDIERCQSILEEKEAQNELLQAEVEKLNREINDLTTSNQQFQTETQLTMVQVSVAMETVNELETKVKELDDLIAEYESKIRLLEKSLEDSRTEINRREMELNDLQQNKRDLQNLVEKLNMANKAHEKNVRDLEYECQRLKSDLTSVESKEKIISDLSSEMDELKTIKNALERENFNLSKRVNRLENKLFQCICTICDDAHEKCSMLNCIFKGCSDKNPQETLLSETREKGIQTFCEASFKRNSIKQVMAAVPLIDEQSSKVITSRSTLPGSFDKSSLCKKDAIISSLYRSVDPTSPFMYRHSSETENKSKRKTPLNIIAEERNALNDNEETIKTIYNPEQSRTGCPEVEEKRKYIIDNVTSMCKVIQVDTEERTFRRARLDGSADMSRGSSRSSSESSKNF